MRREIELLLDEYLKGSNLLKDKYHSLTDEQINFKPSASEWSVKEILVHLGDSEVNAFLRYRTIIAEPDRETFVVNESIWAKELNYQAQSVDEYMMLFMILRKITYKQLKLINHEDWNTKSVRHSYLGNITLEQWLKMYVNHVNQHRSQIERAIERFHNK